jgi:xylan 1,4-beta-xylosidase
MRRRDVVRGLGAAGAAALLPTASFARVAGSAAPRVVSADLSKVKGARDTYGRRVVGAGRAAEGLRADWQRDLALVHRECGFEYIRFHGLLQDEMAVYAEKKSGEPAFNFMYVDALFDAILDIGMKPFVELGFMPGALASGEKTIFWWKGNITPPKDYAKWGRLVGALVEHWTARYGHDEVASWYFEVWNEPNLKDLFWSGDQSDYFKLYDASVRAIKAVSPDYRVGGPATAGNAWVPETIAFAAKTKLPLDFVTTHDYGVSGIGLDENGNQLLHLNPERDAIYGNVRRVREQIAASAMPKLPLHYTEWSTSYSPRDPVHDAYISAAYILSRLKGAEGYADSMSYWTFTDIFEESGTVPSPFHGGFGMINFQGLRKPSFYAYQFLNRLDATELVSSDEASWVCRGERGVQALFWDYTPPATKEANQVYFTRDLPAKEVGPVRLEISGLAPGVYDTSLFRVGYRSNDVYTD